MSTLELVKPSSLLAIPIKVLNFIGFNFWNDPIGTTRRDRIIHYGKRIYFAVVCVNILLRQCLQLLTFFYFHGDLRALVEVVNSILFIFVPTWKSWVFWLQKEKILDIITELDDVELQGLASESEIKVTKSLKSFKNSTRVQLVIQAGLSVALVFVPFAQLLVTGIWNTETSIESKLVSEDGFIFYLAFIWSHWVLLSMNVMFFTSGTICLGTTVLLSIKFMVVNNEMRESMEKPESLFGVIENHIRAIELVKKFNEAFSSALLVHYVGISFLICMTLFLIATSDNMNDIYKNVIIFMMIMSQTISLCHYGNQLEIASLSIAETVYDSKWFGDSDASLTAAHKLILLRAQKPCQVKAWKLQSFNCAMISMILNAAYNYYALLEYLDVKWKK